MIGKSIIRKMLAGFFPSLDPDSYGKRFDGKSAAEIFETIYRKKLWGGRLAAGFHSGSGSRNDAVVAPYVKAVRQFLSNFDRLTVVDVGCGDFHVGSQLLDVAGHFTGCDIVHGVIEQNRRKYPSVDFRVLDAIEEPLPGGDVVLIRQVLQHLSNAQVGAILPKVCNYRYAIITEHIPGHQGFVANLDKPTGADHRARFGSGLVLTEPPFNLKAAASSVICEVEGYGGVIRTTMFDRPALGLARGGNVG